MNRIKVVSFDLDGTLVKREFDYELWYDVLHRFIGKAKNMDSKNAYELAVAHLAQLPEDTRAKYDISYWTKLYNLKSEKKIVDAVKSEIELFEDYQPAMDDVQASAKRIILVTNSTGYVLKKKLAKTGIERDFARVYDVIGIWGLTKDNKTAYEKVLSEEGCKPDEILHVGDSYKSDCLIPREIGIQALFLDREGKGDIRSLTEVAKWLR